MLDPTKIRCKNESVESLVRSLLTSSMAHFTKIGSKEVQIYKHGQFILELFIDKPYTVAYIVHAPTLLGTAMMAKLYYKDEWNKDVGIQIAARRAAMEFYKGHRMDFDYLGVRDKSTANMDIAAELSRYPLPE